MGQPYQYSLAYLRLKGIQIDIVKTKTALAPVTLEKFSGN